MADNQLLLTYSVLDSEYQNGSVRYLRGSQDADSSKPRVGTIDNPRDTGTPLKPTDPDPKMFSFAYNGRVRVLVSKVVSTVSGSAPFTTWTLLETANPAYGKWTVLAEDIVLAAPGIKNRAVATNAYGVAQVKDWLYIVDYDSQNIYTLGVNELNGLPAGTFHTLDQAPLDLGALTTNPLPATAKGQAIIALQNKTTDYLFALYINMNAGFVHSPGYLVRLTVNATTGAPAYDIQCAVGMNPQEIIPLIGTNGATFLVVPSVGGNQQAGGSNGTLSMIQSIPPFSTSFAPTTLVTGDASGTFDIFNIAAPNRADNNGIVYILTHDYSADYASTDWTLYRTTVNSLLTMSGGTLSAAVQAGTFTVVDSGTGASGDFWNILFETADTDDDDRLWFFEGSALLANPALHYTAAPQVGVANKFFDVGTEDNQIGGQNVDWADLTIETVRQALAGVSLKHSARAAQPHAAAAEEEDK
jgi:hypothetical protein